jgi:translation initiation factor IF-2
VPTVRIYAFAKELGLDNKQLLDVCEKAGVKGKGSALASLDDDEVAVVKAFLDSGSAAAPKVEEEPAVLRPPARTIDTRVPEIKAPRPAAVQEEPVAPVEAADEPTEEVEQPAAELPPVVEETVETVAESEPPQVVEKPVDEVVEPNAEPAAETPKPAAATESAAAEPAAAKEPAPEPKRSKVGGLLDRLRGATKKTAAEKTQANTEARVEKETRRKPPATSRANAPVSPLAPRRNAGAKPLRNLDEQRKGSDDSKKAPARNKRSANFNIAAMPEVKQPTASAPTEKVQKPDIALPQDARRTIQAGGTAPLEEFSAKRKDKKKGRKLDGVDGESEADRKKKGLRSSRFGNSPLGNRRGGNNRMRPRPYGRSGSRKKSGKNTAAPRKDSVVLQLPCTVREFSEATGVPAIKTLLTLKQMGDESNPNINSPMTDEMAELLVEHFAVDVEIREAVSLEDEVLSQFDVEDSEEDLQHRPPIVTFLGHVDHGKTSLLDALIGIDVVSGEAGGITQHIRAYQIEKDGSPIAFVDTPGHAAFSEMRARGANVTDIVVLVVAADDGIMPQTAEAINHAKAAEVPIIVALNKCDLPGVTPDKAMQDLATHELLPSEWGGETEVVKTSAITKEGLDDLLETILVTAELHEYKANPDRSAYGTCLEAEQQSDRGVVCKVLVQGGTLNVGDVVVCGASYGRVKAMHDTLHPKVKLDAVGPSTPVNLTGFNTPPGAGEKLYVVDDIAKAREIAATREFAEHEENVAGTVKVSLSEMQRRLEIGRLAPSDAEVVTLNLILRADTKGSIEAIKQELGKIDNPEVAIKIKQALVGGVNSSDVRLAQSSDAVICAFNVVPDENARSLADEVGVEIRRYEVIYKITDDLKATLEGRLKPEEQIVEQGMAMVLRTFSISKTGTIAGCRVMRGTIQRECRMRVIRDSTVIGDYPIDSLKREKDDAKEVQRGMECGIKLVDYNDIKEGDTLEAYRIEEVARTL